MKAIVIAAGMSIRLRPYTDNLPKCLLKINGKSILQNMFEIFRKNGISDISVIKGYKKEKINYNDITYFENTDFINNNILHSLMYARPKLEEAIRNKEDVVISYSDIVYENFIVEKLLESDEPISGVVDLEWQEYYDGRTLHPMSQAEKVILESNNMKDMKNNYMKKIGKHLDTKINNGEIIGEFIGLWKFTHQGAKIFLKHFDRLNSSLKMTQQFQNAKEWQKSYITDIFQEMIDNGEKLHCVVVKKGWKEFDTVQDFHNVGGEPPEGVEKVEI